MKTKKISKIFAMLTSFLLASITLILASSASAAEPQADILVSLPAELETEVDPAAEEAVQDVLQYVVGVGTWNFYFDTAAAEQAGASAETIEAGELLNELVEQNAGVFPQAGFPVWGNWCGPGHGGGTPVDTLDSICRVHDICYATYGYFDCTCDQLLIMLVVANLGNMGTRERAVALAISAYFAAAPCIPR